MKTKQELIAALLEGVDLKSGKILDIGFAQEPNRHLPGEIYGIDIKNFSSAANYKETKQVDLNQERIPYEDNFFDAVVVGCTLSHLANPVATLCEVNRVLKGKGWLLITTPNPHYYWEVVLNLFPSFFKYRVARAKLEEHFFSFSFYDMHTILSRTGFEIVKRCGYLFALVKTPIRFNPVYFPSIAYEILYLARKKSSPEEYTIYQDGGNAGGKLTRVPTKFR